MANLDGGVVVVVVVVVIGSGDGIQDGGMHGEAAMPRCVSSPSSSSSSLSHPSSCSFSSFWHHSERTWPAVDLIVEISHCQK